MIDILERQLARHQVSDLVRKIQHHFGHEHVLESHDGHGVLHAVESLEGLEEVGEGCLEVLLLAGVQDPGLKVELALDLGRDVDAVSSGPGRGERRPGLGQVREGVVCLTLQQLDLHQQVFIIELLQLSEQPRPVRQSVLVSPDIEIEANQSGLQGLK